MDLDLNSFKRFMKNKIGKHNKVPDSKFRKKELRAGIDIEKEHRQGMHQNRGKNVVEKRNNLPSQVEFVDFMRRRIKMSVLLESVDIPKTTIEHWYRNDEKGFSYPTIEHWNIIVDFIDSWDEEFENINLRHRWDTRPQAMRDLFERTYWFKEPHQRLSSYIEKL